MISDFGELLRSLRKKAGLTQDELGRRSGVSERTIRRLETHKDANPQLETVRLLADALGLDPDAHAQLLAAAGGGTPVAVQEKPVVDRALAEAGDDLAGAVAARCKREEELRRIQDPLPLPVRWRPAPDELIDHWANIRRAKPGADAGALAMAGRLDEIVDVYRRIPSGRLVVLGKAGSGKTMLAVRFVLDVLATRGPGDVVPVLVSLGSWDPTKASLRDWLTRRLERDYPGLAATGDDGVTLAAALVARDRVLPVLDGFDELAEGLHRDALEELNRTTLPLLLTSRPHDYAMAVARTDVLTAAAGIEVTDLTVTDLADYLPRTTRGDGWDAVLAELREHPHGAASENLHAVLTTPLMVGLARATYSDTPGRDPAELLDTKRFPTPEAVEDHLLSSFIATAYRGVPQERWGAERAHRWLRHLARHLDRLGSRDLAWWELGTSLRAGQRMLVIGLIAGLVVGFVDFLVEVPKFGLAPGGLSAVLVAATTALTLGPMHGIVARSAGFVLQPAKFRMGWWAGRSAGRRIGTRIRYGFTAGLILGIGFAALRDVLLSRVAWLPRGGLYTLCDTLLFGVVFGAGIALGAVVVALLESPLDVKSVVSPADLLRTNRTTIAGQMVVFGVVFAAVIAFGTGLLTGLLHAAGIDELIGVAFQWDTRDGIFIGLIGGVGGGLGYVVSLTAWGQWAVFARLWLPLTGRLPWALNAFLDDACRRGLLRQSGAVHQFRHARLQDHLMAADLR